MAYHDPYATRYGQDSQYFETPSYNPYVADRTPQRYDSRDYYPRPEREPYADTGEYRDDPVPPEVPPKHEKEEGNVTTKETLAGSTFPSSDFLGSRTKQLKTWRYNNQENLWTRGTRPQCIGRLCCCSLMIIAFLFVSILLPLVLWARPPNISLSQVKFPTTGSTIQLQNDGLSINLGVDINVSNPNYFSVDVPKIRVEIFYPINNTPLGDGMQTNLVFKSHSTTNFTFPFAVKYKRSEDPGRTIVKDLASRCGLIGSTKQDIQVNYKITLSLRFLLVTVSPVFSNRFSFSCPLSESDFSEMLAGTGVTLADLLQESARL